MKRIFFMAMITNALIISSLTSCKKDDLSSDTGNPSATTQPSTINLVAGRWVKNTDGIYVSTFPGILSPANTSNRTVKIYLLANGRETQINHSIPFMGGDLWATNTETDVRINFRFSEQTPIQLYPLVHSDAPFALGLPFSYLVIKAVIE